METLGRLWAIFFPERAVLRPLPYAVMVAVGALAGSLMALSDLGQRLEWVAYDRFTRFATRNAPPAPDIVIVAIDELSFAEIGLQWPWPRSVHARLIEALARAGVRTIALDLLFDAPSDPGEDAQLAAALARVPVVLASDVATVTDRAYEVAQRADPIPPFADAAAALGLVRIPYDPDGVLRRTPLAIEGRPGLALAAAQTLPDFETPQPIDEPRLIRFNGPPRRGILTVSYYQALDPGTYLPAEMLHGKVVLVGRALSAPTLDELPDHFSTPVGLRTPGVEVHANILDMLLRRRYLADPFDDRIALFILIGAVALAAGAGLYRTTAAAGLLFVLTLTALLPVLAYAVLSGPGVRVPVVGPLLVIASVYASGASYRFALVTRERRLIKRAFQHYVAPAIVEQMLNDPSRLSLGGEAYEVTAMFTDLEGFTTLAERLPPATLRRHLSEYFTAMMDLVLDERATLDKFIGDAIMVYFGCPIRDPRHAAQACRAALAMQRRMNDLNAQWARDGLPELRMRIGINTGPVVAGNMGTTTIFNYTILGDCVNLASRLEGVNKEYGTLILIGEETRARLGGDFECRELDWIRVKGKDQPVAVYELVSTADALSDGQRALFSSFASGLELYRRCQWPSAMTQFRAALRIEPDDHPSQVFLDRCVRYAAAPPPPDWDGVHAMTTK